MDIKRKIELADGQIASIAGHVDVEAGVRKAALLIVEQKCAAARLAIDAEVAEQVAALSVS
jgi:hypothetical protein